MEITQKIAQNVLDTVNAGLVHGLGKAIPGQMCVEAAVCFAMGLPHSDNPPCVSPALRRLKIVLNDSYWSSKSARANGLRELALLQLGTAGVLDEVEFAKRVILLVINKYLPPMLRKINLNQEADVCEKAKNLDTARDAAHAACRAAASAYFAVRAADATDDTARAAYAAAAWAAVTDTAAAVTDAYAAAAAWAAVTDTAANAAADADAAAAAYYACKAANAAADAAYAADAADAIRSLSSSDETLLRFAKDVAEILIDMKVPGVQWLSLLAE
jgi:hypothetical protein